MPTSGGIVTACLNHWWGDDVILSFPTRWKATAAGMEIVHRLDESIPYERAILEQVRRGRMGFSYGPGETPERQRWVNEWITAWTVAACSLDKSAPFYKVQPIGVLGNVGHMSYGGISEVAFPQEPARIAG